MMNHEVKYFMAKIFWEKQAKKQLNWKNDVNDVYDNNRSFLRNSIIYV